MRIFDRIRRLRDGNPGDMSPVGKGVSEMRIHHGPGYRLYYTQCGESLIIRERRVYPWVMSTDMHLTQGGVELEQVRFSKSSGLLTGTARRHPGARCCERSG